MVRFKSVLVVAALVGGLISVPAVAEIGPDANPETLTASPLPTWQTNGTVWDVAVVNDVVYVGGNFTAVRPPGAPIGTEEIVRNRLAAFDAVTGELLPWAPSATSTPFTPTKADRDCTLLSNGQTECATVWSIAPTPDKKSIVIGGDFQAIDGKSRAGIAAFSVAAGGLGRTTPGVLNTSFKPSLSGRVYSVVATDSDVWVGGSITKASGQTRSGLAAFTFPAGTLSGTFAPTVVKGTVSAPTTGVRRVALTSDASRLIVGGGFDSLAGRAIHGLQAIDPVTGAPLQWDSDRIIRQATVTNVMIDQGVIYANADAYGSLSEGVIALDAATGGLLWTDGCRGASHSSANVRGVVYVGSHAHDCSASEGGFPEQYNGYPSTDSRRYTLRAVVPNGTGVAKVLHWFPKTDDMNGARAMEFDGTNLWVAGEFKMVDYAPQQGLTRFGFLGGSGVDRKPLKPDAPIATSSRPGVIDVAFKETEDPDNLQLTYEVYRDGDTANPVFTTAGTGPPWLKGWMHFQDNVADGSVHTYDVRATDALGTSSSRSPQATVTAASDFAAVGGVAKSDGAAIQYSFETRVNGNYLDGVSGKVAIPGTKAATGSGSTATGSALSLSGASGSAAVVSTREWTTREFSVEAMFNTTTTTGGSIVSFGGSNSTTTFNSSSVGNLYMDNLGRLNLGLQPNGTRVGLPWGNPSIQRRSVVTGASYNDGAWHHVVATFQPGTGVRIFVDGELAAQDSSMVWTMPVNAYLRIGGDYTAGFPNSPSSSWFKGMIDEVATYKYPLSAMQVKSHHAALFQILTAPESLAATPVGPTGADLTWRSVANASGYNVYRDGQLVTSQAGTSFADVGLVASTSYNYQVAATNASGEGPLSEPVTVTTTPPLPVSVLSSGAEWRYDVSGAPAQDWTLASFNDSAWASGPSQLGHGEGDEATPITPFMPDGTTRRITTYFRTTFELPATPAVTGLALRMKLDDGLILYLNGQEVARDNMPAGVVGPETLSMTWAADDGQTWRTLTIPAAALVDGVNTLAAEVHQNARSSLDLTWDAELTASFG